MSTKKKRQGRKFGILFEKHLKPRKQQYIYNRALKCGTVVEINFKLHQFYEQKKKETSGANSVIEKLFTN